MSAPFFDTIFKFPITEFKRHLSLESNKRILFSGKYGTGKTSFIQQYFELEDVQKSYEVYHLFPVNYSISSNEDIVRYIKYDIILGMLERNKDFPEQTKSYLNTLPAFVLRRMDKVFESMIAMIPEVGKSVLEMYQRLGKLKEEYLSYHDLENKGDNDKLVEYMDVLEGQSGSLFENDVITRIISEVIKDSSHKQSVLIVDDLDRLDPEHVFRILNVFAAHFDSKVSARGTNKFGFDKVIIVCDIGNIRNIFSHRYGSGADFTGYIDKFYSSDVYYFDNREAVAKITENIVQSYVVDRSQPDAYAIYFKDQFLLSLMKFFLQKGDVSLRTLLSTYGKDLTFHKEELDLMDYHRVAAWRVPIVYRLKFLTELVGGVNNLIKIIERLEQESIALDSGSLYPGSLLYVLNYHVESRTGKGPFVIKYSNKNFILEAEKDFEREIINRVRMFTATNTSGTDYIKGQEYFIQAKEFWQLTIDVLRRLNVLGYLR